MRAVVVNVGTVGMGKAGSSEMATQARDNLTIQPHVDEDTGDLVYGLNLTGDVTYAEIRVNGATILISGNYHDTAQIAILGEPERRIKADHRGLDKWHAQSLTVFVSKPEAEQAEGE